MEHSGSDHHQCFPSVAVAIQTNFHQRPVPVVIIIGTEHLERKERVQVTCISLRVKPHSRTTRTSKDKDILRAPSKSYSSFTPWLFYFTRQMLATCDGSSTFCTFTRHLLIIKKVSYDRLKTVYVDELKGG